MWNFGSVNSTENHPAAVFKSFSPEYGQSRPSNCVTEWLLWAGSTGAAEFSKSLKRAESVNSLHLHRGHVNL